jgi:hypothetical protein
LIQNEGVIIEPHGPYKLIKSVLSETTMYYTDVAIFYKEIIRCEKTEDLLPLLIRWRERFPEEIVDQNTVSDCWRTGDAVGLNLPPQQLENLVMLLDQASVHVAGVPVASAKDNISVEMAHQGGSDLLHMVSVTNGYVSSEQIDHLADTLARSFMHPARWLSTDTPGKRLDMRSILLAENSRWRFRHKVAATTHCYAVTIVFDCSGSMDGTPLLQGLALLDALSILARRNVVSGYVILSAVKRHTARWQRFALPVDAAILRRIDACGDAEGLQNALLENASLLRHMSQVFVYTDADIGDAPLDCLELARKGIRPVGLYIGDCEAATQMPLHFNEYLIRNNVKHLVESMVARFRRRNR